jgi:hypothetical protein
MEVLSRRISKLSKRIRGRRCSETSVAKTPSPPTGHRRTWSRRILTTYGRCHMRTWDSVSCRGSADCHLFLIELLWKSNPPCFSRYYSTGGIDKRSFVYRAGSGNGTLNDKRDHLRKSLRLSILQQSVIVEIEWDWPSKLLLQMNYLCLPFILLLQILANMASSNLQSRWGISSYVLVSLYFNGKYLIYHKKVHLFLIYHIFFVFYLIYHIYGI